MTRGRVVAVPLSPRQRTKLQAIQRARIVTKMLSAAPAQSPNCCWDQLKVSLLWVLPAVLQKLQYRLKGFSQCGHRSLSFTVAGTGVCWFITAFYLKSLVLPPHHQLHLLQCTACAARPIQPRALMAAAHSNDIRRKLSALTWHRHDYPQQLAQAAGSCSTTSVIKLLLSCRATVP